VWCAGPRIAPYRWDHIFRESIDAPPGPRFPMGTDDVGRDRLSRLLYGTSISAVLAPAAALCSIAIALVIAAAGPVLRGLHLTTICLSLPWVFLFILLRANFP